MVVAYIFTSTKEMHHPLNCSSFVTGHVYLETKNKAALKKKKILLLLCYGHRLATHYI